MNGAIAWEWLGDRAIRFARPTSISPRAIMQAVRAWPGVIDVVITRDFVGIYFDDEPQLTHARIETLRDGATRHREDMDAGHADIDGASHPGGARVDGEAAARDIELVAVYDGEDLETIARAVGMSIGEVVDIHRAATYVVEMIGFAPGFAYLTGLDARLHLPRRATPRARVPRGSLAIAAGYCAVYPFDSPGGWNLVGRVDVPMFGEHGARLRIGDRVRFT